MNTFSTIRRTTARTWLARSLLAVAAATALGMATVPNEAHAGVFVSVNFAPPALPVYVQPAIPAPGYIWTPGYWAYDPVDGYYWVPGTWVLPPYTGALWTPGYWGWAGGAYLFHPGYWGLHVGYYGGINYGFGYVGIGYVGGYWGPRGFYYNREVNHITNVNITNVYNKTVVVNNNVSRVSYNGGQGGVTAQPTAEEMRYANQARTAPVAAQVQHQTLASHNPAMRASVNHGNPSIAATVRPGAFNAHPATPHTTASALRSSSYAAQAHGSSAAQHYGAYRAGPQSAAAPRVNESARAPVNHAMYARPAPAPHVNAAPVHNNAERSAPHPHPEREHR